MGKAFTHRAKVSVMRNNLQSGWRPNRIEIISCPLRLPLVARCSTCRSRLASCNRLQSEYFLLDSLARVSQRASNLFPCERDAFLRHRSVKCDNGVIMHRLLTKY